jgi:hypothetical protein
MVVTPGNIPLTGNLQSMGTDGQRDADYSCNAGIKLYDHKTKEQKKNLINKTIVFVVDCCCMETQTSI